MLQAFSTYRLHHGEMSFKLCFYMIRCICWSDAVVVITTFAWSVEENWPSTAVQATSLDYILAAQSLDLTERSELSWRLFCNILNISFVNGPVHDECVDSSPCWCCMRCADMHACSHAWDLIRISSSLSVSQMFVWMWKFQSGARRQKLN